MNETGESLNLTPNYTNPESKKAERDFADILERGKSLGVEVQEPTLNKEVILDLAEQQMPDRYLLVSQKLKEEGLNLRDLNAQAIMDRLFGIDFIFKLHDQQFAVDVTSGKGSLLYNKKHKAESMESIYEQMGIDHSIIVRLKQDVTDDLILDLFSKAETLAVDQGDFCTVIKYGHTKK